MKPRTRHEQLVRQAIVSSAYQRTLNGVSHANLTRPAFDILKSDLERYGNALSEAHQEALYHLCGTLTKFAQGTTTGRQVFALSTGLGKTSAIIAWLVALYQLGEKAAGVSVAVSASKVEALCEIKRALVAKGVPDALIALKHSLGNAASEPSTGDADRRFMLVTHARVRGGTNHDLFTRHNGKKRSVAVYDESLWRSSSVALLEERVRSGFAYFEQVALGKEHLQGVVEYLRDCRESIVAAYVLSKANPSKPLSVTLPELDEDKRGYYITLLGKRSEVEPLVALVELSGEALRVAHIQKEGGVLWHSLAVPKELDRVLVLDASYPIRKLLALDPELRNAHRYSETSDALPPVKRFDRVTIHQMQAHGGRHSMEKSFGEQRRENRSVSREIVEVVKSIPATEAILLFTFKKRELDMSAILKSDLRDAGVDLEAYTPDGKDRINFATWGDETSANRWSHCENVILCGVLHRSLPDIAAAALGQLDDHNAKLELEQLEELLASESDHAVFQALSRGKCREIDNGQAKRMNAWLIHRDEGLQKRLERVMPGAVWKQWASVHGKVAGESEVDRHRGAVREYLDRLPAEVRQVSTKKLKAALRVPKSARLSFIRAVKSLNGHAHGWMWEGRTLVRLDAKYHGFTDER